MGFHNSVKKNCFSKHQNKIIFVLKLMNSRFRMTLKSSVVIFRALETSAALLTSAAKLTSLASTASTALFPQKSNGLIFNGIKITNTGPFLWNESSKIQIFTDIWYLFCWRLLRPTYVTFLKTG